MEMRNETIITEFILLGFGVVQELQILLFVAFLTIYILTLIGNVIIVTLVATDQRLHTPMYFFLGNLSCLEICYSSTILPRMLARLVTDDKHISVNDCIMQLWGFCFFVTAECYLLAAMSYDRYLAVCKPLHYSTLMNYKVSLQLITGSWICSFVIDIILLFLILQLSFCGHNAIEHFFCDFIPVINLACNNTYLVKLVLAVLAFISTVPQLTFTMASYAYIVIAILRIPSTTGRKKAFSTCSSHLIVVTIFYTTIITVYVLPDTDYLRQLNKVLSVFYTILTPLVNPFIYSLRNKEVREALRRTVGKCAAYI
ncbi:olfactory receptor 1019-like [Sceloporus undulatus]|uniref:olfactory receptor 1019-like n=1 Tax=Sceloporus undulatus TaxID=8520 RepID=UPI001C4ABA1A|nr:olfactory receptor 1019-like [Sceloporus undulatus]